MCAFGMVIRDGAGEPEGLALKRTTWMSNGEHLIRALEAKCSGDHDHASLMQGRAKQAQVYPPALCAAFANSIIQSLTEAIQVSSVFRTDLQDEVREELMHSPHITWPAYSSATDVNVVLADRLGQAAPG